VAHWRGLESVELADLDPGLNLISGPNESGKSRLVQALRFALFESSKGRSQHKRDLATWGVAPGKPRVSVDFTLAGGDWQLEKVFLESGANTRLRGATESHDGDEAERRLAGMLGVGAAGSSRLKPEDSGIWSLLWVDQGESYRSPTRHANAVSDRRLQERLTAEIGEVAAGERGQRILARVAEIYERYYTASRGAEREPLVDARREVESARQLLQQAREKREGVAQDAERLRELRDRESDLQERVDRAATALEAERDRQSLAGRAREDFRLAEEQARTAEKGRQLAREALDAALELRKTIKDRERQLAGREGELKDRSAERDRAEDALRHAGEAADRAEADARTATEALSQLRRARELVQARAERQRLGAELEALTALEGQIEAIRSEIARLPKLDGQGIAALRERHERLAAARARLEGASASVELRAEQDLSLDGETLPRGETRRILVQEDRVIELAGIARLAVSPGAGELPRLRDAVADAQQACEQALEAVGAAGLHDAERLFESHREQTRALEGKKDELQRRFPAGREAIEQPLRALESRLGEPLDSVGPEIAPEVLEAAQHEERRTREALESARAERDACNERCNRLRQEVAVLASQRDGLRAEVRDLKTRRDSLSPLAELEAALSGAEGTCKDMLAAAETARRRYETLGGDGLSLAVEQAQQAHRQLETRRAAVSSERIATEARLQAYGDEARHEKVQDLEARLADAQAALARIERDAAAARRLNEVLVSAYREARERLTRPVIDRIRPYLGTLFPGSEVWFDDDLRLRGLRSREVEEDFQELSGGAREQLGLLVRIGLAEVLGAGESWPLVLDDVLVNTDPERIRRMQQLLYPASRQMQILLFTCHGALFDALGPDRLIELPPSQRGVPGR
jgi:chromosome segregation ATPase